MKDMKELFIIIGYVITAIYFIVIFLSRPDLRLGRYGAKKFGYNKWLYILFISYFVCIILLIIIAVKLIQLKSM